MYRPKHVEWTCREINSLHIVASVGHSIENNRKLQHTNVLRRVKANATRAFSSNKTTKLFSSELV